LKIGGIFGVVQNPSELDLIEFISQISKLKCERYYLFEWILLFEIQKNYKNWV
jgi:hypothetical protein